MRAKEIVDFQFLVVILSLFSCHPKSDKAIEINTGIDRFDFSSIKNKFKYADVIRFEVDTIQWDNRKKFYTAVDSIEYMNIFPDKTSEEFPSQGPESIDLDFFYSWQTSPRGLIEFTVLSQREGAYCDGILYRIYDTEGNLISSFRVAGSCGGGGYYETASGRFLNDSTYELLSEDNYKTEDVDSANIITFSRTLTSIKPNGLIIQSDTTLKIETQ